MGKVSKILKKASGTHVFVGERHCAYWSDFQAMTDVAKELEMCLCECQGFVNAFIETSGINAEDEQKARNLLMRIVDLVKP